MPSGFQVIGDHGVVQIDSDQVNLVLHQTGFLQLSPHPDTSTSGTPSGQLGFGGTTNPIMCFRTLGSVPVAMGLANADKANPVFYFWVEQATTIQWYLFDETPNVTSNGGLTIYRGDGRVAYSSDHALLKVAGIFQVPDAQGGAATSPFPTWQTGAATVAACLGSPRTWWIPASSRHSLPAIDSLITNGNSVGLGLVRFGPLWGQPINGPIQPRGGRVLAVDVTGL